MRFGLLEVARLLRDYPALVHLASVSPLLPTMSAIKRKCQGTSVWDTSCDAAIADVFHAALYGLTINQVSNEGQGGGRRGLLYCTLQQKNREQMNETQSQTHTDKSQLTSAREPDHPTMHLPFHCPRSCKIKEKARIRTSEYRCNEDGSGVAWPWAP